MRNFTGWLSYFEPGYQVVRAHVSPTKVAIDWREEGYEGGLIATSVDGEHYEGTYTYKGSTERSPMSLVLYESKGGAVVLLGDYRDQVNGDGSCMFQLVPDLAADKPAGIPVKLSPESQQVLDRSAAQLAKRLTAMEKAKTKPAKRKGGKK